MKVELIDKALAKGRKALQAIADARKELHKALEEYNKKEEKVRNKIIFLEYLRAKVIEMEGEADEHD